MATGLNNLAELLRAQGKYSEAEPLYRRSLQIIEKAFGPNNANVATALNNLAMIYHAQGKYTEAEPQFKRSLEIYEKVLGPEHPDVAQSLYNLADLYFEQGKYDEAEEHYRAILQRRPEHTLVLVQLGHLALQRGDLAPGDMVLLNDPYRGGTVQLDNTYEHAWQLNDGTYVLTNDHMFNPVKSTGQFGEELKVSP